MTGAVLWTAGGARIGIGHLTRCRALAGALAQAGADPLIVMEGDPKLAGYAAGEGFAVEIAESREALWAALAGRLTGGGVAVLDRPGLEAADIERLRALGAESIVLLAGEGLGRVPADLAVMDDPEPCGPPAAARRVETGLQFHMVRPDVLAARPAAPWAAGPGGAAGTAGGAGSSAKGALPGGGRGVASRRPGWGLSRGAGRSGPRRGLCRPRAPALRGRGRRPRRPGW